MRAAMGELKTLLCEFMIVLCGSRLIVNFVPQPLSELHSPKKTLKIKSVTSRSGGKLARRMRWLSKS